MGFRTIGLSLGAFSIALGLGELLAGKRMARTLGVEGRERLIRGFGAREMATGALLLARPTDSKGVWGRVAGDALDIAALGAAARQEKANRTAVYASLAFVGLVTIADILSARALSRGNEEDGTGNAAPMPA